jgi:hypothetical protein
MLMLLMGAFCCVILMVAGGFGYFKWKEYKENQAQEIEDQKLLKMKPTLGDDWADDTPESTIDCQQVSNQNLAWNEHRGLTELETWASFRLQKCSTMPVAYTSTPQFAQMYEKLGAAPPNKDPALTDAQKLDTSGNSSVENIISKKKLELSTNGVLSLKTDTGAVLWTTPSGSGSDFSLKFDSNVYNAGNLCVFNKDNQTPWCMLPRVSVQQSSETTDGSSVNLQSVQQQQLASGNMKNTSDTAKRFVMIDDAGNFCMYRGKPGSIQGSSIICK